MTAKTKDQIGTALAYIVGFALWFVYKIIVNPRA
jgi:hypothetical protein